VFCADIVRRVKPAPEMYLGVAEFLGLEPGEVMLVAAHNSDLRHGRRHGLETAFVRRPLEHGSRQARDLEATEDWDVAVDSITALADGLGAPA
jgi:2-haloacid dehalogenase